MSAPQLKIYDADQVTVLVGNFAISKGPGASGYADGEFVRIEQPTEDFVVKEGTDGQVTRSKTNTVLQKVTIRLMQTSTSNAYLSGLRLLDRNGVNGAGVVPLVIRDRQGTSLHTAQYAWVQAPPEVSYDREAKEREWTLYALMDERVDGGN